MFVRGGDVNPGDSLNHAGDIGGYWSSVGGSSNYAYGLGFAPIGVYPLYYNTRYVGQSVRCVALDG